MLICDDMLDLNNGIQHYEHTTVASKLSGHAPRACKGVRQNQKEPSFTISPQAHYFHLESTSHMKLAVAASAVVLVLEIMSNNGVMAAFPESVVAVMDSTADPCDDFFQYTCGTWLKNNPLGDSASTIDYENDIIVNQTNAVIKDIIEEGKPLLTELWESCMDTNTLNALGKLRVGGQRFMTQLDVYIDDVNTSTNVVYVDIVPLTLAAGYYYDKNTFAEIEIDYRKYISTVMNLSGYLDLVNRSALDTEDVVIDLQMKLVNATYSRNRSASDSNPWTPFGEALQTYPLSFGLAATGSGITSNSAMTSDSKIIFSSGNFDAVEDIIQETDLEDLKLYLGYVYVDWSSTFLNDQFYQAYFDLFGRRLGDQRNMSTRSDICLGVETTNLPDLVGKYYIQKMLGTKLEEDVERMVQLIKNALEDHMNKLTWLDASTRREAEAKLAKVTKLIGGPKNNRSYPFTLDSKTYFENVNTIELNSLDTKLKKIGQPVDKSEWMAAATENNAYYVTLRNQIVLPAAGLQSPMFNGSFHAAQNFGSIGATIGHELTHGFDSWGRRFDGDGNRANWWSEQSSADFEKRARCLSDRYSGFEVDGNNGTFLRNVDGNYTITENIADNGGLNLVFDAYRTYMHNASVSKDSQLSTSDGEQLYFIAYGQSWCAKMDDGSMEFLVATDTHSPPKWRVNGAVMNSPDFGDVFKCKVGTKMNPRDNVSCGKTEVKRIAPMNTVALRNHTRE